MGPNWATKHRLKLPVPAQYKGAGLCHFVTKVIRPIKLFRKKELGETQKLKNSLHENAVSKEVCEFLSYENSTPEVCRIFAQLADQLEPRKRWEPLM